MDLQPVGRVAGGSLVLVVKAGTGFRLSFLTVTPQIVYRLLFNEHVSLHLKC